MKLLTSTFIKWTRQNDDGQDNQEEQEKVEFHFHFVFFFFVILHEWWWELEE